MGVEIYQLEPDGVQKAGYDRAGEARDVAAPEEAADHRRQRDDAEQEGDAGEAGGGRRPEQLAQAHENGEQSGPQPASRAQLEIPEGRQPLVIDETVRLFEPLDLVGMEYAWKQCHDAGADRDRQEADQEQRHPVAAQKSLWGQLVQSPSRYGIAHQTPWRIFGRPDWSGGANVRSSAA